MSETAQKNNYILVTVSGADKPGITSKLMQVIAKNKAELADMGQSVTHGLLSLSILIKADEEQDTSILKELLFESKKLGIDLDFELIENGTSFSDQQENHEVFILSCVTTETITAAFIGDVASLLAQHNINIDRIDNVTKKFNSVEITTNTPKSANWDQLKQHLIEISNRHLIDMAFLKDNVFRRSKRLIVFDMDSTLIQTEVIDEMAEKKGVGKQVKLITEKAMNGELNYDESLLERVKMLEGLSKSEMQEILERLPYTQGVEEFIDTVKGLGYKVAVISGGFNFFTNALKQKLGIDYAFANELEFDSNDKLTGKITGTIINPAQKALLLDLIAQQENISIEQVVAIGDGANDLPMLSKAGLGIAFHAKDIVRKNAPHQLGHGPMTSILYFLGIPGTQPSK
jgi:phosphoserine phosphatase